MTTEVPYIGKMDMSALAFGPVETNANKVRVDVYRDSSGMSRANRINRVALCRDAKFPMETRFALDSVREDAKDPNRRGLGITVSDTDTITALRALDERIIQAAMVNQKEWFRKTLTEEQIRARYKPLLGKLTEADETEGVKVKVKCPGSQVPTALHLRTGDGLHRKNGGRVDHLTRGAKVVPIVSASYGLWFMGGATQFGLSLQAEEMIVIPGDTTDTGLSNFMSSEPLRMAEVIDGDGAAATSMEQPVSKVLCVNSMGEEDDSPDGPM